MNVPFYRKKFDELGIDPDSFRSLEDVSKLPFTSKDDLRMSYPYGMFAVPLREVVRVQTSSGTTGMPTAVGYTRNDIKNLVESCGKNSCGRGCYSKRYCPDCL